MPARIAANGALPKLDPDTAALIERHLVGYRAPLNGHEPNPSRHPRHAVEEPSHFDPHQVWAEDPVAVDPSQRQKRGRLYSRCAQGCAALARDFIRLHREGAAEVGRLALRWRDRLGLTWVDAILLAGVVTLGVMT